MIALVLAALLSSEIDARVLLLSASRDLAPGSRALAELGVFHSDVLLVEYGGARLIAPLPPPTAGQMPGCNVGRYEDTRAIANVAEPSPSATADDTGLKR